MNRTLNPEQVEAIFLDCLFKDGEDTSNHVKVEGVVRTVGFHTERLKNHKEEIEALLNELPDGFKKSSGGGMSFLHAGNDKDGNQWTCFHLRVEQLFQLGIGVGKVKCLTPREIWSVLPGGCPYYVIN